MVWYVLINSYNKITKQHYSEVHYNIEQQLNSFRNTVDDQQK